MPPRVRFRPRRGAAAVLALLLSLAVTGTVVAVTGSPALAVPPAPTDFTALTGGPSIALRWRPVPATAERPAKYQVKRNNTVIATVTDPGVPATTNLGPPADVVRYVDRFTGISPLPAGQTFTYQIVPLNSSNQAGTATATKTVTLPVQNTSNTTPKPVVTANTSGLSSTQITQVNAFKTLIEDWYPKLSTAMNAAPYPSAPSVQIAVADIPSGAGQADGTTITLDPDWLAGTTSPAILNGTVLHETAHVIQGGYQCDECGWLTEGVAVYATHTVYVDFDPTSPAPYQHFLHGYDQAERLFRYVASTYNKPNLLRDLNVAARSPGNITSFFQAQTGNTPTALWNALQASVISGWQNISVRRYQLSATTGCIEAVYFRTDIPPRVNGCWVTDAQEITFWPKGSGSGLLELRSNTCLDTENGSTAAGTRIVFSNCAYTSTPARQRWTLQSNGTLLNAGANLCMQTWNGTTALDQELKLATCAAVPSQVFSLAASTL